MPNARKEHWDHVYRTRPAEQVSWFQEEPALSLALIAAAGVGRDEPVVDVGGGASVLVDRLLDQGFNNLSVLDISQTALRIARDRLGPRSADVAWVTEDVTAWMPKQAAFRLWHDRAVFHFLVDGADRAGYVRALDRGLQAGGFVILAPFSLTGPERCSGLPVRRYSAEALRSELGPGYELVEQRSQTHLTPAGNSQDFLWCLFRKTGG